MSSHAQKVAFSVVLSLDSLDTEYPTNEHIVRAMKKKKRQSRA